ncbi:MAG: Conserved hypothetical lipoprotein signal peptide [Hyphomicrobiales bacterium]|nr:Conserved hypothetical lipoprotein signal peptide [Hyphomicrobiales bacterium]
MTGLVFLAATGATYACETIIFDNSPYTVCETARDDAGLRLFLRDDIGAIIGSFPSLERMLAARGEKLVFAMNAGMYRPDRKPVGLYIENGRESAPLNRRGGPGNFHLRPNGVFWIDASGAHVTETSRFAALKAKPLYATQSGPMLVIGGALHPKFLGRSESAKIRNGVGVCKDGKVRFAISDARVEFRAFALFFRDRLGCADALYLDGSISGMHAPDLKRSDIWRPQMGPIIGLTAKR